MVGTHPHGADVPRVIARMLRAPLTARVARVALTLPYWWSGIDKLFHPHAALVELQGTGLPASWLVYALILLVQLGGSLAIIGNRLAWLGGGALAVFTACATYVAHAFWKLDGPARFAEMNIFMEHIALMAGFAFAVLYSLAMSERKA